MYYWGVEKGEYEGHVFNVKYEDHPHLMVIDDAKSEARIQEAMKVARDKEDLDDSSDTPSERIHQVHHKGVETEMTGTDNDSVISQVDEFPVEGAKRTGSSQAKSALGQ